MAGFDFYNQRAAKMPGMVVNAGRFDFSAGSSTIDVPTTLSKAFFGMAQADFTAQSDPQATLSGYKVGDVSNGKITFLRGGGSENEDARMSYIVVGY